MCQNSKRPPARLSDQLLFCWQLNATGGRRGERANVRGERPVCHDSGDKEKISLATDNPIGWVRMAVTNKLVSAVVS